MGSSTRKTAARDIRVCFLFNAQRHQLLHGISTAVALARRPGFSVTVMSPSRGHIDYARTLVAKLGGAPIAFVIPASSVLTAARRFTGRTVPPKLLTLAMIAPQLYRFDAVAVPERTSIILKTMGVRRPAFVHLDHGAGDRSAGFDTRIAKFDFVLMAGEKHRHRLTEEGLIREGAYALVGYPKFDAADAIRDARWSPFPGDARPIVLYNPHFSPLGSWERMGGQVLAAFAAQDRYNLILAPHVRLLDGKRARSRWRQVLARYAGHPRIHIDPGSDRSIDMTYTALADVYLGDVSSQVYEFLRTPRPCVFLDAQGIDWRGDENYAHWRFGPVARDATAVIAAIDTACAGHDDHAGVQQAAFAETFGTEDVPGSERAAQAVAEALAARRHPVARRRAMRTAPAKPATPLPARAMRRAAMIVPAVAAGWMLHDIAQPPPTIAAPTQFVDEAVASHRILLLRDAMRSQPNAPDYDVDDIRRNTGITMPRLPAGWQVRDVQVFPSNTGPSVQALITAPGGSQIALIGMRIETPAEQNPVLDRRAAENIAYWEEGDLAFALVGPASSRRLLALALQLSTQS